MKNRFLMCGIVGWCLEIIWTGLHSLLSGKTDMMGRTSLLMFPIYGCAAVIGPIAKKLAKIPTAVRGCLYAVGIFLTEFVSGTALKTLHMCPWDYSHAPLQINGVVRLDYFPVWFSVGLLYEKILGRTSRKTGKAGKFS